MEAQFPRTGDTVRLRIISCGGERCSPGHMYGPAVRDHYLIHFIASGTGTFQADGRTFRIGAGQGFIIFPDEITVYRADDDDPWTYDWMGYVGEDAEAVTHRMGLSRENRVFSCEDPGAVTDIMRAAARDAQSLEFGELAALGGLMRFLAHIAPPGGVSQDDGAHRRHYQRARWFMFGRYAQPITVRDVADFVGVSRSQLYRVFREAGDDSPKDVLTRLRLTHIQRLLSETDMSLEEIAYSAGLASAQRLGVMFRAHMGISPGAYRRKMREKDGAMP